MSEKIPDKLIFSTGSESRRKRTLLLVCILVCIQTCLIWPVYPLFSGIEPFIFGLPLSFAWVIGMVVLSFLTMLIYFRYDIKQEGEDS